MTMLGPLKRELFKYRRSKTRSMDGSLSGFIYPGVSKTSYELNGNVNQHSYEHQMYLREIPSDYRPNLNSPSVDWIGYEVYEPSHEQHPARVVSERAFLGSNAKLSAEVHIMPQDDMALIEQFLLASGKRVSAGSGFGGISEACIPPTLENLKDTFAELSKVFPENHPDLINLKASIIKFLDGDRLQNNINKNRINELSISEYAAEDVFDHQIEILEKTFGYPDAKAVDSMANSPFCNSGTKDLALDGILLQENISDHLTTPVTEHDVIRKENLDEAALMNQNQDISISQIECAIDQIKEQAFLDPFMDTQYIFNKQYMSGYMIQNPTIFENMGPIPYP